MLLTVGFDGTPAARQAAGIGRYTRELLSALSARSDPFAYRLYYAARGHLHGHLPELDDRFRVRALPLSDRMLNVIWQRARIPLPVQVAAGRFDVFHSPDFSLPPTGRAPSVLTIHDLAFMRVPECTVPSLRSYLMRVVPRAAKRATAILTVSENTRRDVVELLDVPEEKVTTVYEGVLSSFRETPDGEQTDGAVGTRPFILAVGTLEPRKNYERILEAYALARDRGVDHELIVAGAPGWLFTPVYDRVRRLKLGNLVRFVTPSDVELLRLYRAADACVYASLYEGFGLPALEALACGCPLLCGNTSSLPEVVGDAALLCNPYDVGDLADALVRLLGDTELRARLRQAGPRQAAQFSWARCAEETVEVYCRAAGYG